MARTRPQITLQVGNPPKTLQEAVTTFTADCKARNLSDKTLTLNTIILKGFADCLGKTALADITSNDIRMFLVAKASATSAATAARYYDTLKRFFAFLHDEGFISADPMAGLKKPRFATPVIQPLSQEQVEAMLAACNVKTFAGMRDRLALLILIDCGLRASELCDLELSDVDIENQQFLVRHGKGDRSRRVPFGGVVLTALRHYLARRAEVTTPALMVNVYGEPVNRYRLRAIVLNAARRAGIEHPHMGPHLLRHSCAVSYLRNGGDVFSLQKVLGHRTLTMTRRYSELADTDIQDKHRLFSPADRLSSALTVSGDGRRRQLR